MEQNQLQMSVILWKSNRTALCSVHWYQGYNAPYTHDLELSGSSHTCTWKIPEMLPLLICCWKTTRTDKYITVGKWQLQTPHGCPP